MKIVIGIQTCNRWELTKKTVDGILKWNPEAVDMPWVISDDGSKDNTRNYVESLSFIDEAVFYPEQSGITWGLKRLVDTSIKYGDVILYLQNDWEQTRRIDFKGLEKFYEEHPNTGHIQMIEYKDPADTRASNTALRTNAHTREKIIPGQPINAGSEVLLPGRWHYCDIPGFTNLKFAVRMFDGMIISRDAEGIRMKNIHESGCDNYMLTNQPYENLDFDIRLQTPGRRY